MPDSDHDARLRLVVSNSSLQASEIPSLSANSTKRPCHLAGIPSESQLPTVDRGMPSLVASAFEPPKRPMMSAGVGRVAESMAKRYPFNGPPSRPFNGPGPESGHAAWLAHTQAMGKSKRIRARPVDQKALKARLSRHLKEIQTDMNKSADDMAAFFGIPVSTYKNWVSGASFPQIDGIELLANHGVDVNYLFLGIGPIRRPTETEPADARGRKKAAPQKRRATAAE